jgi:hypothetical protein
MCGKWSKKAFNFFYLFIFKFTYQNNSCFCRMSFGPSSTGFPLEFYSKEWKDGEFICFSYALILGSHGHFGLSSAKLGFLFLVWNNIYG